MSWSSVVLVKPNTKIQATVMTCSSDLLLIHSVLLNVSSEVVNPVEHPGTRTHLAFKLFSEMLDWQDGSCVFDCTEIL